MNYSMLNTLPAEIKSSRKNLLELSAEMELTSTLIKKWESAEMLSISNELDDKGKPVFSNAEKRQLELDRRKSMDTTISELECDYEALKREIEDLRIEVQYKQDIQENLRALARIGGGQ